MPRLAANLSLLFPEVDLLGRFPRTAAVGFAGAEIQHPYDEASARIARAFQQHELEAVLFNTPTAVGALPGREAEFEAGITRALEYCAAAGCGQIHCMAGVADGDAAEDTFVTNLKRASAPARAAGVRLLIEPLNIPDNPGYFLHRTTQARRIIERVGEDNVGLQYDLYHVQIMEGRLAETIEANLDVIRHVQIAGVPGRHEPDADQEVQYPFLLDRLDALGYGGWVGCEYRPRGETRAGLAWAAAYGIDLTDAADPGH